MRLAAPLLALALAAAVGTQPSQAMMPALSVSQPTASAKATQVAPLVLAGCGKKCQAKRRAWRHYHYRPHRPPHYRPRPSYHHHHHHYHRRRGDAAAAAIIGGVIGLGIGASIANSNNEHYGYDGAPDFGAPGGNR